MSSPAGVAGFGQRMASLFLDRFESRVSDTKAAGRENQNPCFGRSGSTPLSYRVPSNPAKQRLPVAGACAAEVGARARTVLGASTTRKLQLKPKGPSSCSRHQRYKSVWLDPIRYEATTSSQLSDPIRTVRW